ncbi:MAG: FtsX-like permease family protein [Gemmatimonas sp.]|nr:FtsX-like permease family protein [Gemmatimonas sp.]
MTTIANDFRFAFRRLAGDPGFSAAVLLTLALAIGANVALFTVVNGVLLRPLPYPEADRIVEIRHHAPGLDLPELRSSAGLVEFYRDRANSVTEVAAIQTGSRNLSGDDRPERVPTIEVTPDFFDVLAIQPVLGRQLVEADAQEGAPPVAILTYPTWQASFGGDPEIVGRMVEVSGTTTEIAGVMSRSFAYPDPETALLLPLSVDPSAEFGAFGLTSLARLGPGADVEATRTELNALQQSLPERFPDLSADFFESAGWSVSVEALRDRMVGDVAPTLWVLLGTAGLVLLIAGANVANLFLVRAESRRREVAVRGALGASGARIARTFLAESLLLGLSAGVLGVLFADGVVELLRARGPVDLLPRLQEVSVDATVLVFAAAVSVLAGLALGLLPVPSIIRQPAAAVLHGGRGSTAGPARHRARRLLIVIQIALALVLLVGAGLMLRSVLRLRSVDPGLRAEGVLSVGVGLGEAPERSAAVAFYHRLLEEVAGLPGVVDMGATTSLPVQPVGYNGGSFEIESRPLADDALPLVAMWHVVTDGYFETVGIPLLEGRTPVRADAEGGRPVAWVNETFAQRYLDGRALGERIRISPDAAWTEVVGVVGDVRNFGLDEAVQPFISLPMTATGPVSGLEVMQFVVRTNGSPTNLVPVIQDAVRRVDATVPITAVRTMEEIIASSTARTALTMVLLTIAAGVALVLGVVGLYGVISYLVTLRRAEIGVRIALGARPESVRRMILRQGIGLTLTGVVVGLIAAVAVTRVLASLLFEVSARDPVTFAIVAGVLTLTSLVASYVPARRATRLDPMVALRTE